MQKQHPQVSVSRCLIYQSSKPKISLVEAPQKCSLRLLARFVKLLSRRGESLRKSKDTLKERADLRSGDRICSVHSAPCWTEKELQVALTTQGTGCWLPK